MWSYICERFGLSIVFYFLAGTSQRESVLPNLFNLSTWVWPQKCLRAFNVSRHFFSEVSILRTKLKTAPAHTKRFFNAVLKLTVQIAGETNRRSTAAIKKNACAFTDVENSVIVINSTCRGGGGDLFKERNNL